MPSANLTELFGRDMAEELGRISQENARLMRENETLRATIQEAKVLLGELQHMVQEYANARRTTK